MANWIDIWTDRDVPVSKNLNLEDLLRLNGYDGGQSVITPESLRTAICTYERKMQLERGESIYEVGCGAGAFLHTWHSLGYDVGGSDLSPKLIEYAKKGLPSGQWNVLEANKIPISRYYDHITAFGLFLYFPDYDYAKEVLYRMLMSAKRTVSIFDIPDLAKKEECENYRRKMIPDYDTKYATAQHLYYSKEWWLNIAEDLGLRCSIYDQDISGYENSQWRFNVTFSL